MPDEKHEPQRTQQTQPKKGKPIEIPVPKRREFERALQKATRRNERPKR